MAFLMICIPTDYFDIVEYIMTEYKIMVSTAESTAKRERLFPSLIYSRGTFYLYPRIHAQSMDKVVRGEKIVDACLGELCFCACVLEQGWCLACSYMLDRTGFFQVADCSKK